MTDLRAVENMEDGSPRNKIIVSVAGEDEFFDYEELGLSFESPETDILSAIRPMIQEKYNQDIQDVSGSWLYKTRKAVTNQNIHVIPNSTAGTESALSYLDDAERINLYETLTRGCMHLWSKGRMQENRVQPVLDNFAKLADEDPLFLAHFTSYAFKKLDSKDLKVVATFMSSLSDADGTAFSEGSPYKKPNWRIVAQAAFMQLDPKLALRVLKLANSKRSLGNRTSGTHFSRHLKTAARKYLRYRESNPKMLEGIRKAGLTNTFKSIYRIARVAPSPEACQILRWKQKPGYPGSDVEIKKDTTFDFSGMSDLDAAEKIRQERLKPQAVLGALPDKISPVVAIAVLEQCTGDQAVVLTSLFEEQGLLKHEEVREVYEQKLQTAKQALDRVERIKQELDEDTQKVLKTTRATVRKQQVGDVGRVFVHVDISSSMVYALDIAKQRGSVIAECVNNPEENFYWGTFSNRGDILPKPKEFVQDAFKSILYGIRPGGMTNCFALYGKARELGCDTDIYITDGWHTHGNAHDVLQSYLSKGGDRPKQAVIVRCGRYSTELEEALKAADIPVAVIDETQLTESALITQAVKTAIQGAQVFIDDIMETPLLELPKWWYTVH